MSRPFCPAELFLTGSQARDKLLAPLSSESLSLVIRSWILELGISYLFYGIYATVVVFAIYAQLSRQPKAFQNNAQWGVFITTMMMFLCSTFLLVSLTSNVLGGLLYDRTGIAYAVLQRVNYFLIDIIVVWRAWALFPYNRWVQILLILLIIGSGVGIFFSVNKTNYCDVAAIYLDHHGIDSVIGDIFESVVPVLLTNFISTSLVGWKAWYYRKTIKVNLNRSKDSRTRAEKILLLLIESGFIYCLIWIGWIMMIYSRNLDISVFYAAAMPFIASLFPVLIILLATHQDSKEEHNDMSLSQSIIFTSVPSGAARTSDFEPESRSRSRSRSQTQTQTTT